jgi:hypothetical protein
MILMKAAGEAGECLVRASELSRLSICVFAGHHRTCPLKCDLHIQHAFRYTMSLILLECLATNFVAWISGELTRVAKRRGGCVSPRLAAGTRIIIRAEVADRTKRPSRLLTILEGRARVAPDILSVQPDVALCVVSRWWTAMHYISRRNRKSS